MGLSKVNHMYKPGQRKNKLLYWLTEYTRNINKFVHTSWQVSQTYTFIGCVCNNWIKWHSLCRQHFQVPILWTILIQHSRKFTLLLLYSTQLLFHCCIDNKAYNNFAYCQTSNTSHSLVDNKIVEHSDVVGASPVGAAPTTSSFLTLHLASMDWAKTKLQDETRNI